jgi:hypothetical protein
MGCQSDVILGSDLTFSIKTHDPSTGGLSDADSAPSYRVYEENGVSAILTGTMTLRDAGNTDGSYVEKITCLSASGFEYDKSYDIDIEATVGGVAGGITYTFRVHDVWAASTRTVTQTAIQTSEALDGDDIYIHRGDTNIIPFSNLGNIVGRAKLWFTVKSNKKSDDDDESIIQIEETAGLLYLNGADAGEAGNGSITVTDEVAGSGYVTLDEVESDDLNIKTGLYYDIQVLNSGVVSTLIDGEAAVTADVTRAVA